MTWSFSMTSIVGVDEAGRGPVLGPLVVGICCIPAQDEHLLVDAGVKDSKDLSRVRRRELEAWFHDMVVQRGWYGATVSLDAETIDMALQGEGLNWLEVDGFAQALETLPNKSTIDVVADACDVRPQRFTDRITSKLKDWPWPNSSFVSEHKADMNHPVVAMASILAKEERDRALQQMAERLNIDLGSGYPSDPGTKAALPHLCKQDGIDIDVRWGWATVERFWQKHRHGDVPVRGRPRTEQKTLFNHDPPTIS